MNPLEMMQGAGFGPQQQGTNLLSVLLNLAFGFVLGLMIFLGPKEVIAYGSKLASDLLKLSGEGGQMASMGFAVSAAPFVVITPIAGLVAKELSSVRTLKAFGYFAAAVVAGIAVAF